MSLGIRIDGARARVAAAETESPTEPFAVALINNDEGDLRVRPVDLLRVSHIDVFIRERP